VAPSPDIAQRIFANRLYQQLSNELGGSTEYMAMEKLHELLHVDAYDFIVVDTPPSTHARDLLNAPLRLIELLASNAVRFLKTPTSMLAGIESGMARMALNAIFKVLQRWTGFNVLSDLADFAGNFEGLVAGFRARAADVDRALHDSTTSFVLITTPEPDTIASTLEFQQELEKERFPVAGVIANRVCSFPPLPKGARSSAYPEALRHKLEVNYADFAALTERDRAALSRLAREASVPLLATLPVFDEPPASLASLRRFANHLVKESPNSRE
jgi:anion-transporting  ArsA/GET3 family ATPase